jgi:cell pole-organizing protein PopZ
MTVQNVPTRQSELAAEQKAHEPSMEDILASIRRIIADDDALPLIRRQAEAAAASAKRTSAQPEAIQSPIAPEPVVAKPMQAETVYPVAPEALTPTPAPASSAPAAVQPVVAALPVPSLPVAARLAAINLGKRFDALAGLGLRLGRMVEPEVVDEPAPPQNVTPRAADRVEAPVEQPRIDASVSAAVERLEPRPSARSPESGKGSVVTLIQPSANAADSRPIMAVVPSGGFVAANSPERGQEPRFAQEAGPAAPEAAPEEAPLVSADTGAKVGAAFDALAGSMALRDPEMIERLARELLRPMLKTWLDDNLPVVVERLVRAEIERVARGRSS